MKKLVTYIRLRVEHDGPIPDLAKKIEQRAYNLDGVDDVQASIESPLIALPVHEQPVSNGHGHDDVTEQMTQAMDSTWSQLS